MLNLTGNVLKDSKMEVDKTEQSEKQNLEDRVARLENLVYQMTLKEDMEKAHSKIDGLIDKYDDWPAID
jgi:hypothetical protein